MMRLPTFVAVLCAVAFSLIVTDTASAAGRRGNSGCDCAPACAGEPGCAAAAEPGCAAAAEPACCAAEPACGAAAPACCSAPTTHRRARRGLFSGRRAHHGGAASSCSSCCEEPACSAEPCCNAG